MKKEYKILKVEDLEFSALREIRQHTVEQLKKNIEENGFDEARVLLVIPSENEYKYIVAGGNHRLQALLDMGIEEVPCLVDYEGDLYQLAILDNEAEKTFAPLDLFDYLDMIKKLKENGYNQTEIGSTLRWSQDYISKHLKISKKINTEVLKICKVHQIGRVLKNNTNVLFDFTEGWFRSSGLYELYDEYQIECIQNFIDDKCNWSKTKLQQETAKYKQWQRFIEICEEELQQQEDIEEMIELIENNTFRSQEQLQQKIDDYNKKAQNKLCNNDALIELEELEDGTIDIIITDPPYGQDYISHRSKFNVHITREGVVNDNEQAFDLLDKTCEILTRKTKKDAHIYIMCSWKVECRFRKIISKYFEVKNVIIWDKMNHGAGDLEGNWSDRYEMIIFATKGNRKMTKRKENIISIPKISSSKLLHPTQKPTDLMKELLSASIQPNDTICDPFMGLGSTIKAVKELNIDLNYIGIEIDKNMFEKAKAFIND